MDRQLVEERLQKDATSLGLGEIHSGPFTPTATLIDRFIDREVNFSGGSLRPGSKQNIVGLAMFI